MNRFRIPFRRIGYVIGGILIGVYLILPALLGLYAAFPSHSPVGNPPEGSEEIILTTNEGLHLAAWYKPSNNGAVIILIHGSGESRESIRPYVKMLADHGYGVLAPDLSGHGESEGQTNRFGWQGTRDVGAAIRFVRTEEPESSIGGLGLSLGGEVLTGAASTYPEMKAIVAEGATHRCTEEFLALDSKRPIINSFFTRVLYLAVQLATGQNPPTPLLESITNAEKTRFLYIAAGTSSSEIAYSTLFQHAVPDRVSQWIAEEASHTGAYSRYPDTYEEQVIGFFDTSLRDAVPEPLL